MRSALAAVTFLTRIPLPYLNFKSEDLSRSLSFFPLVGLLLGGILSASAAALLPFLPSSVVAAMLVGLFVLLTGGLHIDGLADLFDALGGGKGSRERMLEIMRDSRIGAHGASAIVVVIAIKILAVTEILLTARFEAIILFPIVSRWTAVLCILAFPYARKEGLGSPFKTSAGTLALPVTTMITGAAVYFAAPAVSPICTVMAVGFSMLVAISINRRLGGLTGDVYGALIEICETIFLVSVLARVPSL